MSVICAEGLGKRYLIGHQRTRPHDTLRDTLVSAFRSLLRRRTGDPDQLEELWALRDVSFEVQRGECVGVIGRNGAGKSTLLKLLSRVTEPSAGRVRLRGRVASLLEVGTGFHPELTGRENVFLNGAILGMRKDEIRRRFDEIVAFAEVERFLDTPVKRYSTGMSLRLAFAVAAHLEAEILIVDEALAVGDASFQKKCLGRMGEVATAGRTVLLVSHSMPTLQRLCSRGILLDAGRVVADGAMREVAELYLSHGAASGYSWERSRAQAGPHFRRVFLCDHQGKPLTSITTSTPLAVGMEYAVAESCPELQIGVGLLDANGDELFGSAPHDAGVATPYRPGVYRALLRFPRETFMPRRYGIRVALYVPNQRGLDVLDNVISFNVEEDASFANSNPGGREGALAVRCDWAIEKSDLEPGARSGSPDR